ncbi:NUDIX hydrolase [Geobacter pickeringii]|uniref:GDP-mannose pyrophosphatase n=1 Tax=Geobacter pickeringii TaxID=345632 RepID=A0A0B5B670_9BACT|nr:NUDIX hydrolase [Geobacter pickeringii]AJE02003.1 DNA mismatch repair protein MutT [Geobacter pickeringii]
METRNETTLFEGLVIDVEQMEVRIGAKGWHTFQVVRHPGGVAVVPLHDDGTVTLIRQLRPSVAETLLEIPAGRLEPGEDPAACGLRELTEETGLSAGRLTPLGTIFTSPGVFDEAIHLYLAVDLTDGEPEPEQYEEIETVRMPLEEALAMAADGRIRDGKTIAALLRASRVRP